jgi:hypothetical protein
MGGNVIAMADPSFEMIMTSTTRLVAALREYTSAIAQT